MAILVQRHANNCKQATLLDGLDVSTLKWRVCGCGLNRFVHGGMNHISNVKVHLIFTFPLRVFKAAYYVTMNIFRKKKHFLFKSFVKVELSYVVTINLISTAENCMGK